MSDDLPPSSSSADRTDARTALEAAADARVAIYQQVGAHTVPWRWIAIMSFAAGAHAATLDLMGASNQIAVVLLRFALLGLLIWAALRIRRHIGAALRFRGMPRELQRPVILCFVIAIPVTIIALALAWRSDLVFSFTLAGAGITLTLAAVIAVTRRRYRQVVERMDPSDELRG